MDAVIVSARLDAAMDARLSRLAERTGRSKSFYLKQALAKHLDDPEERCWADDVIDRWESSGRPSRPLEDLKALLGL
jgi:RHH-type rel operon transcriptional repressor/antitoxin RelB